jgi:hypothetical protein
VGIEELVEGGRRPHQTQFNAVEAASVHALDGDQVTVTVASFSRELVYAAVPFIKKGSGAPAAGDPAVLHSDSNGNPIYAVVLA